jgi:excisionase family DNA binding protein
VARLKPKTQSNIPAGAEFITPQQAAVAFQVKEATVRLWLSRKLIRGKKIGHTWLIPRTVLDELKTDTVS